MKSSEMATARCQEIRNHLVGVRALMSRSQSSERWAVEQHIKGIMSLMNEVETDVSATKLRLFAQTK